MRLLIRPLMLRLNPASRLYPGPKRWILDAPEVNDLPRKMTKTPGTIKKISLPRILLLIHHYVGPNLLRHSPRKIKTVVLAKKNPDNKTKARILLLLTSTPPQSRRTKTKIRARKTYLILIAILVSKKVIMPTNIPKKSQKLASVLTISMTVTENSEWAIVNAKEIEQVTCIQYSITFPGGVTQNDSTLDPVSALFDSGSKVNAMHPAFAKRLSLVVQTTNVGVQKINGTTLEIYGMVVAAFSVTDQPDKVRFFKEIFRVVNVSLDIVLAMSFPILSGADIDFPKSEL